MNKTLEAQGNKAAKKDKSASSEIKVSKKDLAKMKAKQALELLKLCVFTLVQSAMCDLNCREEEKNRKRT